MTKKIGTKQAILSILYRQGPLEGGGLARKLGVSRQALNVHMQNLITRGKVRKVGVTRGARYLLSSGKTDSAQILRRYSLPGLEEDNVFEEITTILNLRSELPNNTFRIARYALTEMVNNAIDHSQAAGCELLAVLEPYQFSFRLRDRGIGLFDSIQSKFNLDDEYAALGELLKGKTTTMRERHSGEGIFFTSKAGDHFTIRSHRIRLDFDNIRDDVLVHQQRFWKGTEVAFQTRRSSRRRLGEIFENYSPEEFGFQFERTRVRVKLFQRDYTSRSEARRLVWNLDRFRDIVLDFKGVHSMGQAFADEIFRVFTRNHPDISINVINANPAVEVMIRHVRSS